MCQFMTCFDLCWQNQCGAVVGCSWALFCVGCWMCMPAQLQHFRGSECCKIGCNQGWGSTMFCCGNYCLIPDYLRDYSIRKTINQRRGNMYDIAIVDSNPGMNSNRTQNFNPNPYN